MSIFLGGGLETQNSLQSYHLDPSSCGSYRRMKQAEAFIRSSLQEPIVVPCLIRLLSASPSVGVRQLAAVLLRQVIITHWPQIPPPIQQAAQATLLLSLRSEPRRIVSRAVTGVVGRLGRRLLPLPQGWSSLLELMGESARSSDPNRREMTMHLFLCLAETISTHLVTHVASMAELVSTGLADASSLEVRIMALRALCAMLVAAEGKPHAQVMIKLVTKELPRIIDTARGAAQAGEEDAAVNSLDVLCQLVDGSRGGGGGGGGGEGGIANAGLSGGMGLAVDRHVKTLLSLALMIGRDTRIGLGARDAALMLIPALATTRPRAVARTGVIPAVVETCLHLLVENLRKVDEEEIAQQEEDESYLQGGRRGGGGGGGGGAMNDIAPLESSDAFSAGSAATSCLEALANNLRPEIVFSPIATAAQQLFASSLSSPSSIMGNGNHHHISPSTTSTSSSSSSSFSFLTSASPSSSTQFVPSELFLRQRAIISALGDIAEGCESLMRSSTHLPWLLSLIVGSAMSSSSSLAVRTAACFTLGQWAQVLLPELVAAHAQLIPPIIAVFDHAGITSVSGGGGVAAVIVSTGGRVEDHNTQRLCAALLFALDAIIERMNPSTIQPYLPQLISRVMAVLSLPPPSSSITSRSRLYQTQTRALGLASSLTGASRSQFAPFASALMGAVAPLLSVKDGERLELRGGGDSVLWEVGEVRDEKKKK